MTHKTLYGTHTHNTMWRTKHCTPHTRHYMTHTAVSHTHIYLHDTALHDTHNTHDAHLHDTHLHDTTLQRVTLHAIKLCMTQHITVWHTRTTLCTHTQRCMTYTRRDTHRPVAKTSKLGCLTGVYALNTTCEKNTQSAVVNAEVWGYRIKFLLCDDCFGICETFPQIIPNKLITHSHTTRRRFTHENGTNASKSSCQNSFEVPPCNLSPKSCFAAPFWTTCANAHHILPG